MPKYIVLLFLILTRISFAQEWGSVSPVQTAGRDDGLAFSLNGSGYVVTGNLGGYTESNKLFQYNSATDLWTEKALFPGTARQYSACFTLENTLFLIGGYSENGIALNDVWMYDSSNDLWIQKNNFPGLPRWHATALTISETGYFGMGTTPDSTLADFWEYDYESDKWSRLKDYPAGGMRSVLGFPIQNKGIFGEGFSISPTSFSPEWYQFDPGTRSWSYYTNFPGGLRSYGTAISNGLTTLVCGGITETGTFKNDCYTIDYSGNWKTQPNLLNAGIKGAKGFYLNGEFYLGTGIDQNSLRTSDFYKLELPEFDHDEVTVFPNPAKDDFTVVTRPGAIVFVYTINGKLLKQLKVDESGFVMIEGLPIGIYVLSIEGNDLFEIRKIAKI